MANLLTLSLSDPLLLMHVLADHREKLSGFIELLKDDGIDVTVTHLKWCDYIINHEIGIERKTGRDLLVSIIDGRLFRQASQMKKHCPRPVFLVEGSPFTVDMDFNPKAIRGAILSLQVIWYIPVLFSRSKEESCEIFRMMGEQEMDRNNLVTIRHGYRPKKMITRQLFIVQGLPNIGPLLAKRMLDHFGSVRAIMNADAAALSSVEGLGRKKAEIICRELSHR